jgi:hypothetical protein
MPAAVESLSSTLRNCNALSQPRRSLPACPELDCLRHLLPPGLIAAAELRASEADVGADRALIAADIVSEEAYLAALTAATEFPFAPLDDLPREACPLSDERLLEAVRVGVLPINLAGRPFFVVAPRALGARGLLTALRPGSDLKERILVTTVERLRNFVSRHGDRALARRSAESLRNERPDLSAGSQRPRPLAAAVFATTLALFLPLLLLMPGELSACIDAALGMVFLAWAGLRIAALLMTRSAGHARLMADNGTLTANVRSIAAGRPRRSRAGA